MHPNGYQMAAIRTENKDFAGVRSRLNLEVLVGHLQALVYVSKNLDAIKKNMFYGKDVKLPVSAMVINNREAVQKSLMESDRNIRLVHSILGLGTETGELAEMLLDELAGCWPKLTEDWDKEFGDVAWYLALGIDATPSFMESVLKLNVDKLRKRYPDKFEEGLAQNHDSH